MEPAIPNAGTPQDTHGTVCLPSRPLQNGSSPRVDHGWAGDGLHMHTQGSRRCDLRGECLGVRASIFLGFRAFGLPGCWVAAPATRACGFRQSTRVTVRPERNAEQDGAAQHSAEQSTAQHWCGAARSALETARLKLRLRRWRERSNGWGSKWRCAGRRLSIRRRCDGPQIAGLKHPIAEASGHNSPAADPKGS